MGGDMAGPTTDTRLALLEQDMDGMKRVVESIGESTKEISESLQKLTLLEERHAETRNWVGRVFTQVEQLQKNQSAVERELPGFRRTKRLVDNAVYGILAAFGMALIYMVFK